MILPQGTRLGEYEIVEPLGTGGMAIVYRARDVLLGRHVAIKLLSQNVTRDSEACHRFLREAQAASALDHPNICTIFGIDESADGQLYLVMAYYAGETLKSRLAGGRLAIDDALDIAIQVARGLAEAHSAGIVHRDIKPANIMVTTAGLVKILDFGISKLVSAEAETVGTEAGKTFGTVAYMAPEQLRGEMVDARADVWALGVVLYEMLAGRRPFMADSLEATAAAILTAAPPSLDRLRPESQPALRSVVAACLEAERTQRIASAVELGARLHQVRQGAALDTLPTMPVVHAMPSIAVLPFTNMSADPDQDYFCDGLSEELIASLAKLDGLRVVARASAFQFRGEAQDLRRIGEQLGVTTVLLGSVRKMGKRLRVNAQLVKVVDGYHLWSERYDREIDDLFDVQDEIARAVVSKLRIELLRGMTTSVARRSTANIEAYTWYMRGRHYRFSRYNVLEANKCYNEAVRIDPGFAAAWAGVADVAVMAGYYGLWSPAHASTEARRSAERALTLDATLADAHEALARIRFWFDWEWGDAELHYRRAIELAPENADVRISFGGLLEFVGRADAALAEITHARQLDPLSIHASIAASIAHLMTRRYDQAVAELQHALELHPDNGLARWYLCFAYLSLSRYEEALSHIHGVPRSMERLPIYLGLLGATFALAGKTDEAHQILSGLLERSAVEYISPYTFAMVHLGFGHLNESLDQLEKAYQERCPTLVAIQLPYWDAVRSHPRFQQIRKAMNLPGVS